MEQSRAKCALLVLCGLPGSGKTTLAASILKHVNGEQCRLVPSGPRCHVRIVTFDDWLHRLIDGNEFSPEAWQISRREAFTQLSGILKEVSSDHDGTYSLIIADDNHHLRSMRHEAFQLARDHCAAFLQLHLPCTTQMALERNGRRSGVAAVPRDALIRMSETLEPPQPERFTWEAASLTLPACVPDTDVTATAEAAAEADVSAAAGPGSVQRCTAAQGGVDSEQQRLRHLPAQKQHPRGGEQHPQQHQQHQQERESGNPEEHEEEHGYWARPGAVAWLCGELWRLWGPAPPPRPSEEEAQRQREEGRVANAASHLHGLDLRSRRVLGQAVAAAPAAERAAVARRLNEKRRSLLQAARDMLLLGALGEAASGSGGSGSGDAGGGDERGSGAGLEVDGRGVVSTELGLRQMEEAFARAALV